MSLDDGRCHICRRVPLVESRAFAVTTCESCDETAAASRPSIDGALGILLVGVAAAWSTIVAIALWTVRLVR